jgi:Protein of unknown function (DUF998)
MRRIPTSLPALIGVAGMSAAMLLGPVLSPPVFEWVRHTTSEQASQHLPGAWAMRFGFIAYGLGVLCSAAIGWRTRPLVRVALAVFGLGLVGAALWSNAPIMAGVPPDLEEDRLHSIASGVVGTGFAAACAFRLFAHGGSRRDALSWIGLVVSVVIPLAMVWAPEVKGVLQRGMFLLSMVFVAREFRELGRNQPEAGERQQE